MQSFLIKSSEQKLLDSFQAYCNYYNVDLHDNLEACIVKSSLLPRILDRFANLFSLSFSDDEGMPLLYKAFINAFLQIKNYRIANKNLLLNVTRKIAKEVICLFSFKIVSKNLSWTLKDAIYEDETNKIDDVLTGEYSIVEDKVRQKDLNKLIEDLTERVLTKKLYRSLKRNSQEIRKTKPMSTQSYDVLVCEDIIL